MLVWIYSKRSKECVGQGVIIDKQITYQLFTDLKKNITESYNSNFLRKYSIEVQRQPETKLQ